MNKIYIVSDTHFGHAMLIENGYRPRGYGERIYANISCLMLDAGDIIYHLGDVAVAESSAADAALNAAFTRMSAAKFVLIRGNHDSKSTGWYLDKGWSVVLDAALLHIYGLRIFLTHEPEPFSGMWDVNIHGHLHDGIHRADEYPWLTDDDPYHILYSCERYHYQPMPLKSLVKKLMT